MSSSNIGGIHLVFFDVDNTIVKGYTQKYFIKYLTNHGYLNFLSLLLGYAWFLLYRIKLVKDLNKPVNRLLSCMRGWDKEELNFVFNDFFYKCIKDNFFQDAVEEINFHLSKKHEIFLISASLEPIIDNISNYLGVDNVIATKLSISNNLFNGSVDGKVIDGDEKLKYVKMVVKQYSDNQNLQTYFYSDHCSDYPLLKFVDHPNVVNPDKHFKKVALREAWRILQYK